jgi:ABC-type polysaccharide/polyol phosphate export permease
LLEAGQVAEAGQGARNSFRLQRLLSLPRTSWPQPCHAEWFLSPPSAFFSRIFSARKALSLKMLGLFDAARYRDLVLALVARDLKVRYRRSVIGFLWTMLQPLMTMLVLALVFSSIMRFEGIENYPVYAMTGILWWNFFSQTIIASMNSLKGNAGLLQKVAVPHAVFPLATMISGCINLLLAMVPLAAILIVTGHRFTTALLFIPVSILISAVFSLGAGLLLSPLAVFFHDVVELISVVITLAMYLTPIFYPMSILPAKYVWVVRFNPLRSILEVFRDPIYLGKVPPISHLSVAVGLSLLLLAVGAVSFKRSSDRIPYFV